MLDINKIRKQFPILNRKVNGEKLTYLDNGATSQKPQSVIDAIDNYYRDENSNVHRGIHLLSERATDKFEQTRIAVQLFIGAKHNHEIIFTKGTTDSVNLVANGFRSLLKQGDEILISELEHHSNIVPWQMCCDVSGATLKVIPILDNGELDMDEFEKLLSENTKLVALSHVANSLGTINPVEEIIEKCHRVGTKVLIDGAQAASYISLNLQDLDADFYCFSAHKMYGPTGVGVLYGKEESLNELPPYQGGGGMIKEVKKDSISYGDLPNKYEAGTMATAQVVAFDQSIKFLEKVGMNNVIQHEKELMDYGKEILRKNNSVKLIGNPKKKGAVLSFTIEGIHPHDIATILDEDGVAIRAGHHCCQILHETLGITATARASLGIYNTKEDIDRLNSSINKCKKIFSI